MNTPENPPAFPVPDSIYPNGQVQIGTSGMTLRDYFAAKVMPQFVSARDIGDGPELTIQSREIAFLSYMIADAMLAERAKGVKE